MLFKAHFAELALNAHARNYFNAFIVTVCMNPVHNKSQIYLFKIWQRIQDLH